MRSVRRHHSPKFGGLIFSGWQRKYRKMPPIARGTDERMKGIIFTELLDFVELRHGYETVDAIIGMAAPASGGVYTAVGSYDFTEMAALLGALSQVAKAPAPDLLQAFGRHLFARFAALYPAFFENIHDPLAFIETVETFIHVEVRKLYPDAELPRLRTRRAANDTLLLSYRSCRPLGHLCLGLIQGCGEHFGTDLQIQATSHSEGLDIAIRRPHAALSRGEAHP
jgi:hypothetical protein